MTEAADAIAALKAKLDTLKSAGDSLTALSHAAKTAQDAFVALAGAKYVHVSMNADWDPKDHPRDPNTGQFMKTLGGFIFGKAKKAEYSVQGHKGHKKIELDLAPGDVAFQTPAKNVIISHADGSYSLIGYNNPQDIKQVPAGSYNNLAAMSEQGQLTKIAENPGLKVDAKDEAEAADKLEHPDAYSTDLPQNSKPSTSEITEPPVLKAGKKAFTAKQYTDYQNENLGKVLFTDKDSKDVLSGSWIDVDGKPYLVHASPTGKGNLSVYRWVGTKQQASNLVKENFFTADDLKKAVAIDDPTGKPYGVDVDNEGTKTTQVKAGSLMSQAVVGAIPNTATAHKNHIEANAGKKMGVDKDGKPLASGGWVEIEGKPFQFHSSPNEGNIALAKWVSTKKQASNNTYDFPASVLSQATKISDPTGSDYTPLPQETPEVTVEPALGENDSPFIPPEQMSSYDVPGTILEDKTKGHLLVKQAVGWHFSSATDGDYSLSDAKAKFVVETGSFTPKIVMGYAPDDQSVPVDSNMDLAPWEKELLGILDEEPGPVTVASVPDAPIGTKVTLTYAGGTQTQWEKIGDNKWKASIEVTDASVKSAFGVLDTQPGSSILWEEPGKDPVTVQSTAQAVPEPEPEAEPTPAPAHIATTLLKNSDDLDTLPFGTVLVADEGSAGYYVKGIGKKWSVYNVDGYKLNSGVELEAEYFSNNAVAVAPPGSPVAQDIVNKFGLELEEASVWYGGTVWTLKADKWVSASGAELENEEASALFDTAVEAEALHNEILSLVNGDTVTTTANNGHVDSYVLKDGNFFQGDSTYGVPQDAMASYALSPSMQKVYTFATGKAAAEDSDEIAAPGEPLSDIGPDQNVFVHPVSGIPFVLNPGDKVYKHKTSEGGYIIETTDPTTPINFFTTNGKLHQPKASQKNLATGYEVVETWPGKKDGKSQTEDGVSVSTANPIAATSTHVEISIEGDQIQIPTNDGKTILWEKKADGSWVSPNGGWNMSNDMMKGTISKNAKATFLPNNGIATEILTDAPEANPVSPWGSEESLGNNPEPFKKPAPKKKSKKETLPNTFTLPSGKELDLKPGEFLVKTQYGGEDHYIHVFPNKGDYNAVYNAAGTSVTNWTLMKLTPAGTKKHVKEYGGEILAEKPVIKIEQDFSSYDVFADAPLLTDEKAEIYPEGYAAQLINNSVNDANIVPISWGGISGYEDTSFGKPWSQCTADEKASLIAQYADLTGRLWATLEKASETKSEKWDKSDKSAITKYKNGVALAHRIATLAHEIVNDDTEWDEDTFESELAFLTTKANQGGTVWKDPLDQKFPASQFMSALTEADNQRKFKKSLESLGFDPLNGTTEDYDTYAKSKGFDYLAALTPEQQKVWVLADLGDPSLSVHSKSAVTIAAQKVKSKVVIAGIAASLTKGENVPSASFEAPKGLWEKAHMKAAYDWIDATGKKVTVTNTGNDEWDFEMPGSVITVNDAVIQTAINGLLANGTDFNESDEYAYGNENVGSMIEKFEKKYGVEISYAYASSHGNIGSMEGAKYPFPSNAAFRRWLFYKAVGDQLGAYLIEEQSAPNPSDVKNHIGSPQSTTGAIAWRTLVGQILAMPGGGNYIETGAVSQEFRDAATKAFPLIDNHISFNAWKQDHPHTVLKAVAEASMPGTAGKPQALKPFNVPDDTWNFVQFVTATTDLDDLYGDNKTLLNMSEQELDSALINSSNAKDAGLTSLFVSAIPLHLKRLAVWAAADSNDEHRLAVLTSIAAKAKAGEFLSGDTPVWVAPNGTNFPISPGASVYKAENGGTFVISGPPMMDGSPSKQGFVYENGQMSTASSWMMNDLTGHGYAKVFTMPNPVKWDQAKKDVPDLDEKFWIEAEKVESGASSKYSSHLHGALLTAELKKDSTLQADYPNIYAQHATLPEHVRQAVFAALDKAKMIPGHTALLDVIEYKALKGHYATMQSKGLFDLSQPWTKHLSLGQMSNEDIHNFWSLDAKSAYMAQFGLSQYGEIAPHLDSLLNPATVVPDTTPSWGTQPIWSSLNFTPTGKKLGGMHTKYHLVDQNGNEWMQKTFESDKSMAPYRIEAEVGALAIGDLYGFRGPIAAALHLHGNGTKSVESSGGTYSYVQYLKGGPGTTDLVGFGPNDLSLKQLQQAMEEHVLDWITANHDTHQQNLRFDDDGNVFGIDKGQAFKHFPNDQLAVGYLPPENGESVWYDKFYKALQNGQISKEQADEVTKHVLRRAQKISKDKDEEFRALLETALSKRPMWPNQFPTKEKFIDALVERKHNAFDDFVGFYKNLYAQSPYDWDIDTENLVPPMLDKDTHIAVSQDFADEVKKAGVFGKSIFFASSHLEDSHILMTHTQSKDGKNILTGEAKIREDGDAVLTAWLKKQTITNKATSHQEQSYAPPPSIEYEDMPQNAELFNAMVQYSKTVSSHNASGDKQYNATTVSHAKEQYTKITSMLAAVEAWEQNTPGEPFDSGKGITPLGKIELHTMEQHEAWKSMLETYKGYYEKVKEHEGTDLKVKPHFTQVLYTATPEAKAAYKGLPVNPALAPSGFKIKYNGVILEKQSVGNWKNLSDEGVFTATKISKVWLTDVEPASAEESAKAAKDAAEKSAIVNVGTKQIKVTYRKSALPNVSYDEKTGIQTATGGEFTQTLGKGGQDPIKVSGNMYEIDFEGTKILYFPWKGSNVNKTQQGMLRIQHDNWSGEPADINGAFDVLRQIGLDLDPATEESMELFYWQHMEGILNDRQDGNSGKWAKVGTYLKANKKSGMSTAEELQVYRNAWAEAIGTDKVAAADFKPHFSSSTLHAQGDGKFTSGRPYWVRPDWTMEELAKSQYMKSLPASSAFKEQHVLTLAMMGVALSTEERLRLMGEHAPEGMSSSSDQTKGSSAQVYTRPGVGFEGGYSIFYHPKVLLRTHNYRFQHDTFGAIDKKKSSASWDPQNQAWADGYELCVKNSVSVLDDIVMLRFGNETSRQQAITFYKSLGITMINGVPIEQVFVVNASKSDYQKVLDKMTEYAVEEEKARKKESK